MALKILVDSTFDFTAEQLDELGVSVVRLSVRFGEREFTEGVDITPREFYERLIESDELPTTSQASPSDFSREFERLTGEGSDVLALTLSSRLSGTYQSACIAAEDFPGRVRVLDSRSVTIGAQILARYAARLAAEGRGLDEAFALAEAARERAQVIALLDTLEYLKRGGRISGAAALAGGLLSIKPVVTLRGGEVAVIGKARGSKNGTNLLSQLIEKHGVDFSMPYALGYSGLSDATLLKYRDDSRRLWEGRASELPISVVGSVIGTHAGPGAIGVAFFGERSHDGE